jgi:hypothetical protein
MGKESVILKETLIKFLSAPYIPHSWGTLEAGGHPQTPTGEFSGLFFQRFPKRVCSIININIHAYISAMPE